METNQLVIGHLKGFNWWFGKIVDHKDIKDATKPTAGSKWVYWFGDYNVTEVSKEKLFPYIDNM